MIILPWKEATIEPSSSAGIAIPALVRKLFDDALAQGGEQ